MRKHLKPVHFKTAWADDSARTLQKVFESSVFNDLLSVVELPEANARPTALEAAIIDGRIKYSSPGSFKGKFTAAISKQIKSLSQYAEFKNGEWLVPPYAVPEYVLAAAAKNYAARQSLKARFEKLFEDMADKTAKAISDMDIKHYAAETAHKVKMAVRKTFTKEMALQPELESREGLLAEYTHTDQLPIVQYEDNIKTSAKNFAYEEIVNMREKLMDMIYKGEPREDVRKYIARRLKVSKERAKFIATQETRLFTTQFKKEQYKEVGLNKYKWSVTRDSKLRDSHRHLANSIQTWDNAPVVDPKTGRRAHAGADFNCRCVAIPIVD